MDTTDAIRSHGKRQFLHAAASFLNPKAVFFAFTTGSRTAKNSAQNPHYEIQNEIKHSRERALYNSAIMKGDTRSHILPLGAVILAPTALDLASPICKSLIHH